MNTWILWILWTQSIQVFLTQLLHLRSADTLLSPGYDINSSTKEIFANLQKQVQEEQAAANEVNNDVNKKARERRSKKRRYSGTLQAYDNMSSNDIVKKFEHLNRRGSALYSKEVC